MFLFQIISVQNEQLANLVFDKVMPLTTLQPSKEFSLIDRVTYFH